MGIMSDKDIEVQNFMNELELSIRQYRFDVLYWNETDYDFDCNWNGLYIEVDEILAIIQKMKQREVLK